MLIEGQLKQKIISILYFEKTLSIVDLSNLIGKSVPHVTKALVELVKEGFIVENGFASSSGGRKPQVYSLRASALYIIAVAMDQLYVKVAVTDLLNNPNTDRNP